MHEIFREKERERDGNINYVRMFLAINIKTIFAINQNDIKIKIFDIRLIIIYVIKLIKLIIILIVIILNSKYINSNKINNYIRLWSNRNYFYYS